MRSTAKPCSERTRTTGTRKCLFCSLILILALQPAGSPAAAPLPSETEPPAFEALLPHDAVPGPALTPAFPTIQTLNAAVPDAPPLPDDCSELVDPGEAPPAACVYGYIYQDGAPVAAASVSVASEYGALTVVTGAGPSSAEPYFVAPLSASPIAAQPGDIVRVSTTVAGDPGETTFTAQAGSRQVDVWLSTSCGPTYVGGVIAADSTWQRACSPYVVTDNVLLSTGRRLRIEPGVTVRFQPGKSLRIDGELLAAGLPGAMVRMTSEGASLPGTWGYVLFAPSCVNALYDGSGFYLSGSIMQDALVEYAGGAADTDNAALRLDNCSPYLLRTHVRYSGGDGVRIYDGGMLVITDGSVRNSAGWGVFNRSNVPQMLVAYSKLADNGDGGVYSIAADTQMRISNNWIADNTGDFGIYIANGSGVIDNNWIAGNKGGVRLSAPSDVLLNVIHANRGNPAIRTNTYVMNINHNIVLDNENTSANGGALYVVSGASNIVYNVFAGNHAVNGGGIYVASGSIIRYNAFLSNHSTTQGAALYSTNNLAVVDHNTILGNQAGPDYGAVYLKQFPSFVDNNVYGNDSYDLCNGNLAGAGDLKAELNWWGTIELPQILAHIWDYLDDSTLSLVDFDPAWAAPQLGAPISPPTGLQILRDGNRLELSWNENPESDTAGYKIYYDTDGPGYPYNGSGLPQGDSPLDVGEVLNSTLTGIPDGRYHFSLAAYDSDRDGANDVTEGNESWFSNDVTVVVGQLPEAGFSATPTSGVRPLTVNFTNLSAGNITACNWSFGDGATSSSCGNPSHTYPNAGSYTVSLSVSGPGGSDTDTQEGLIIVKTVLEIFLPLIMR